MCEDPNASAAPAGLADSCLLHVATSAEEHLEQLGAALELSAAGLPDARAAAFVGPFLRSHGIGQPVAPLFAAELVALAGGPMSVRVPGAAGRSTGRLSSRFAFVAGLPFRDKPMRTLGVRTAGLCIQAWAQLLARPGVNRLVRLASARRRQFAQSKNTQS